MSKAYDLAVIGGGTAGLTAAFGAAGLGARVCLIEQTATGGDCLWTGCVPSKSLIAAATLAQRMRRAEKVGLAPVEPEVDFSSVMAHVHAARRQIYPQDSPERLRAAGVEVIEGRAGFEGRGRIVVGDRLLRYGSALIATGSEPVVPGIEGLDEAGPLTSLNLWDLDELPHRLVVLGGGPIGCELGQAFRRLGSSVSIVEMDSTILGKEEPQAQTAISERLAEDGVELLVNARAVAVRQASGESVLVAELKGRRLERRFDRILVAAGRRPNTAGLKLGSVGVKTRADGAVLVDDHLRTTGARIFAAGDVVGGPQFTHLAGHHGRLVVTNALFHTRRKASGEILPWVTFTDPEVGRVGLSEAEARERWKKPLVRTFSHSELDRAICLGETAGFAKLIADPKGRLVGATVVGVAGGETVAELSAWISNQARLDDLSQAIHPYPTFSRAPAGAADDYLREKWLSHRVRRWTRPLLFALRLARRMPLRMQR